MFSIPRAQRRLRVVVDLNDRVKQEVNIAVPGMGCGHGESEEATRRSVEDTLTFFHQLATLVSSGMPWCKP